MGVINCELCGYQKPDENVLCPGCGKMVIIRPSKMNSISADLSRLKEVLIKYNKQCLDISRDKAILWPTLFIYLNQVDPSRLQELISLLKRAA